MHCSGNLRYREQYVLREAACNDVLQCLGSRARIRVKRLDYLLTHKGRSDRGNRTNINYPPLLPVLLLPNLELEFEPKPKESFLQLKGSDLGGSRALKGRMIVLIEWD